MKTGSFVHVHNLKSRALSVLLSFLMVLSAVSVGFVLVPKAGAATAGDYKIFIGIQVTNGSGSEHEDNLYVKVTYDKKDGSGSAQTGDLLDHSQCWGPDSWSNHYANIETTIPGFPTRIDVCVDMKGVGFAYLDTDALTIYVQSIKLYNYKTGQWVSLWEGSVKFDSERNEYKAHWDRTGHHNDNRTSRDWESYDTNLWDTKPYAETVTVSGPNSINVNTNGSTTNTSSAYSAVAKDQWGVNWREDASLSLDSNSYGITFSGGKISVPASANRANNYTVTVRGTCGSISGTKTVTINTFDYKVTFYDEDGTTVIKSTQTIDYDGSATAPSNPTKAADATKHYTFSGWTGDGYTNIKTGAQTKTVKASYTGTDHSGGTATCTAKAECSVCHTLYGSVNANNHNYNYSGATFNWSGYTCANATVKCTRDNTHTTNVSTTVTSSTTAATCTTDGQTVYTAKFTVNGTNYTSTKTQTLAATGHNYNYSDATFNWSGYTCANATVKCTRNNSHTTNVNTTVTSSTTAATCTTDGQTVYTAKFTVNGTNYTSTKTQTLTAPGHNYKYSDATFNWSGYTCANATVKCERNNSHTTNVNTTVTSSTTAATCTEAGQTVYTAKFTVNGTNYTSTKTQTLAATGHNFNYSGATFNWNGYTCTTATARCSNNTTHTETENTSVTSAVTSNPTYTGDGVRIYTAKFSVDGTDYTSQKTAAVPSLYSLIDLDDAPPAAQGFTAGGVYTFSATTKKSGIGYSLAGLSASASNAHPVAKSSGAITGYNVNTLTLSNASVTIMSNNKIRITPTDMTFSSPIVFYAVVAVTGTQAEKYDTNTVYSYKKITVRPTQLLYYEESEGGMTYANIPDPTGTYGVWNDVGNASGAEAALASAVDAGIGYSDAYADFVTYSGGTAKKISVSADCHNDKVWPSVSFSFTGTGFDLISVTDSKSGVFTVSVTQNGQKVAKFPVDTYYGSTYTPLFYNLHTDRILPDNHEGVDYVVPLYFADENRLNVIPADEKIYDGMANNVVYTTDISYASSQDQAYGWVMTGSDDVLYQIPVISVTDLDYGTYDVIIEARFAEAFRHYNTAANGVKYYDLTVDGVRIYEPAKNSPSEYADGGNGVDFTDIRDTVGDGSTMLIIDGMNNLTQAQFENYINIAPKNEIYLRSGGTAVFEINAEGCEDLRLGMKSADGSSCSVQIAYGNSSKSLTVSTATEMYYSLKDLVGTGRGTLTVSNNGSGVLSLTKVMAVTPPSSSPSNAPKRILAVTPVSLSNAMSLLEMQNADLTIDAGSIETTASEEGVVTVTLKTSEDAQTIVIRDAEGNVIDPGSTEFTIDETGGKNWTVILSEESSGEYTYTLQAVYENGYAPEEPKTVTVTVIFPESEDYDSSAYDALSYVLGIFMAFSDIIRILSESLS